MAHETFRSELEKFRDKLLKIFFEDYPQHKNLARWLSEHPAIANDVAHYARMYTIDGIGQGALEHGRERTDVFTGWLSEDERALTRVAGMFEVQGRDPDEVRDLRAQAVRLRTWADKYRDLYDVRKMGQIRKKGQKPKRYWVVIAIETTLYWETATHRKGTSGPIFWASRNLRPRRGVLDSR